MSLRDAYRDLRRRLSESEMVGARLEVEVELARYTAESKEQEAKERLCESAAAVEELRERLGASEEEVKELQSQRLSLEQLVKEQASELERVLGESQKAEATLMQDLTMKDSEVEKMHAKIAELSEQTRKKEERISHLLKDMQDEKEMQAEVLKTTKQRK